jgi:low temperature requirement protein LtrA
VAVIVAVRTIAIGAVVAGLSAGGVARAAFLLLIVWWAWIYTTWMVNWFDPARRRCGRCSPA